MWVDGGKMREQSGDRGRITRTRTGNMTFGDIPLKLNAASFTLHPATTVARQLAAVGFAALTSPLLACGGTEGHSQHWRRNHRHWWSKASRALAQGLVWMVLRTLKPTLWRWHHHSQWSDTESTNGMTRPVQLYWRRGFWHRTPPWPATSPAGILKCFPRTKGTNFTTSPAVELCHE